LNKEEGLLTLVFSTWADWHAYGFLEGQE